MAKQASGNKNRNKTKGKPTTSTKKQITKKKQVNIPVSSFPRTTVEKSIELITLVYKNFAQSSVPWDTLASLVGRSPKTVQFKYLVWSTEAYGLLVKGDDKNYTLSEISRKIVAPTYESESGEAVLKAILTPTILSKFYTDYDKHPLPSEKYLPNILDQKYGIPLERFDEYRNTIIENAKYAGILMESGESGDLFIMLSKRSTEEYGEESDDSSIELENIPVSSSVSIERLNGVDNETEEISDFSNICFVVTPIGLENSEFRKHADLIFSHLIKPVVEEFDMKPIRADTISKPGIITQQILEYLVKSRLCISDLSYSNPNVFYELGIRHMSLLPNIQLIRKGDKIPFDVSQGRTIIIDLEDKYSIIDRIESGKNELRDQIKSILSPNKTDIADDNPVKYYLPGISIKIPK